MKAAPQWDERTIKLGEGDEAEGAILWVKDRDAVSNAQLCWEEAHCLTKCNINFPGMMNGL